MRVTRLLMTEQAIGCSKYPPAFGIDLLIDDAEGVSIEGERFGFRVFRISGNDLSWFCCFNLEPDLLGEFDAGQKACVPPGRIAFRFEVARQLLGEPRVLLGIRDENVGHASPACAANKI